MIATVLFILLLIIGIGWMIREAARSPRMCGECGRYVGAHVTTTKAECPVCGTDDC